MNSESRPEAEQQASSRLKQKLCYGQGVFFLTLASIVALFIYWNFFETGELRPTIFLIQSLPILAFLPGFIKKISRSYNWLCFILLFYFIMAVDGASAANSDPSDYLFIFLVVTLFISAMMTSRWIKARQFS